MNQGKSQWLQLLYFSDSVVWKQQSGGGRLDFGTGWSIMDGVEGNGVDMACG